MASTCSYEDDAERDLHYRAIQRLAQDTGISEEEVQILYEAVLRTIRERARIKDYLAILVSRNVKDVIKRGGTP
jgi:uncharacterized protein (DUF2236 family)